MQHTQPMAGGRLRPGLLLALAVALMAVLGVGCGRGRPGPPPRETRLLVDNRGYFDVIVYSVPSPGASGRRLGNVNGGSMTALRLTSSDLQLGNQLVVRVRALATNRAWVSPAITILIDWGSREWLKYTPLSCQLFGPVSVESLQASWKARSVQLTWQDQSSITV